MSATAVPPRPRRRRRYIALVILVVIAVASVVLGGVTTLHLRVVNQKPAAITPAPTPSGSTAAASTLCRPAVAQPKAEPWLEGNGSAEREWDAHASELRAPYQIGPNGWVFYGDQVEDYLSQAVGRKNLTASEVERWVAYYGSIRDALAQQGIEFYIVVTPSTSSVYPEELPSWMQEIRGSTSLDQFLAGAGDLPVVDIRQPLIDAKTKWDPNHLYSWDNSHWTDLGGYVGWTAIAPCVNALFPGDRPLRIPAVTGAHITGDFNEFAPLGAPSPGADWAVPDFAEPLQPYTITDKNGSTSERSGDTDTDGDELPATTEVAKSWTGKSALIVRDSMAGAITPYLQQAYSPTWQVGHQYSSFEAFPDYRELIAEHHPDVVVLQLAERHLVNSPPVGGSY